MKTKHEDIFAQLSATFSSAIVEKWLKMVEIWEADPTKPNPYEEPESGMIILWYYKASYVTDEETEITLQDVRLQLLKEEAVELREGSKDMTLPHNHDMSLTGLITTGFDIEDRQ